MWGCTQGDGAHPTGTGHGFSMCPGVTGMGMHMGIVPCEVLSVRTIPCTQSREGGDRDIFPTDIPRPSVREHRGHHHRHPGRVPSPARLEEEGGVAGCALHLLLPAGAPAGHPGMGCPIQQHPRVMPGWRLGKRPPFPSGLWDRDVCARAHVWPRGALHPPCCPLAKGADPIPFRRTGWHLLVHPH